MYPSATAASEWSNSLNYSISHPATLLQADGASGGWFSSTDGTAEENYWTKGKSIFDPCPPGWKIPEGGEKGLWAKSGLNFSAYDSVNKGYLFGESAWYSADSYISGADGTVKTGGTFYPSSSTDSGTGKVSGLMLTPSETSLTYGGINKADALPVRCCKIGYVLKPDVSDAINLSEGEAANCYIANQKGKTYQFYALKKGNGENSLDGTPVKAEVLWESFGTSEVPERGDVIASEAVLGADGYVSFTAGRDGNAVIAVKDASDNILWSWHIWVCDGFDPVATAQVYYNNAGTLMDRNLGAISATPGDARANGLFFQWGRKDPFIGTYQEWSQAKSTLIWPDFNNYSEEYQEFTLDYSIKNPTRIMDARNSDWLVDYESHPGRWASSKTEYDPCPPGWRVPASGPEGVWAKALGTSDSVGNVESDEENRGFNLNGYLGDADVIWYPGTGGLLSDSRIFNYWNALHWGISDINNTYNNVFEIHDEGGFGGLYNSRSN